MRQIKFQVFIMNSTEKKEEELSRKRRISKTYKTSNLSISTQEHIIFPAQDENLTDNLFSMFDDEVDDEKVNEACFYEMNLEEEILLANLLELMKIRVNVIDQQQP